MIKVTPFFQTIGSEKFKEFLALPFRIDMLYPIHGDSSCQTLFDGWKGKDMINWHKFINENKISLEFYPSHYIVKKEKLSFKAGESLSHTLPLPKDINDFINDMYRFEVQLFWTEFIDENYEPKDYLKKEEIENYYKDLLKKMGKSHELL